MTSDDRQNIYTDIPDLRVANYERVDPRSGISRYEIEATDAQSMEFEARSLDDYFGRYHAHMTRPHRHSFYQILWFRNPGSHFIDFIEYRYEREAIFFIAKDHLHYFEEAPPAGHAAALQHRISSEPPSRPRRAPSSSTSSTASTAPQWSLPDPAELAEMTSLLEVDSRRSTQRPPADAGNDVIMCLLSALLVLGHRCKTQSEEPHHADDKREAVLFLEFKWHLEQDYAKAHQVSHYAALLGVSPQTLSEACRSSTGVSAKTLISERVILEAKRLLCYSEMPVSEIAAQIGYDDPLYFSRAFKISLQSGLVWLLAQHRRGERLQGRLPSVCPP